MISTTTMLVLIIINSVTLMIAMYTGYKLGYMAKTGEVPQIKIIPNIKDEVVIQNKPKQDNEEPKNFYE